MEFLGKTKPLSKPYRGFVVDNNDPKKLQRVKCTVAGIMNGPVETLPWIYPHNPPGMGARQDIGSFMVPAVNTELVIEFPTEDIYAGFYTGTWQSADTHPGTFDEDYPNSYGFTDDVGNSFRVNKLKGFSEWKAASGSRLRFEKDSTVEIRSRKAINFISGDGKTSFSFDMENGTVNLNPKGGMTVGGLEHTIAPQKLTINTATMNETVNGAKTSSILSGYKLAVGGPTSESVVGSKGIAIGGDESKLIAGSKGETIGMGSKTTIVTLGEDTKILQGDCSLEMALGSAIIKILAGNIDYLTLAGSIDLANLIGGLSINALGGIDLSNKVGGLTINPAGGVELFNPSGALKISPVGVMEVKSLLTAEFAGTVLTKIGSSSGITQVNGTLVTLGGAAGMPVARVGDTCIGIGNLGIPVMSTIMMGSFKVLAT